MEKHEIETVKRPWHFLKEFAGSIALIAGSAFMLSQVVLIILHGGVYWYEDKVWLWIGDLLVCAGGVWLGVDLLRDDLKNRPS